MTENGPNTSVGDENDLTDEDKFDTSTGVPWWIIAVGVVALVFGGIVAVRTGNVLFGLIFPPEPPKPANVEHVNYTQEMHGVDRWEYHINPASTCDTITFLEGQGGTCAVEPGYCTGEPDEDMLRESALAATCSGEEVFSVFVMGWETEVYDYDTYTELFVSRNIPWTRSPTSD